MLRRVGLALVLLFFGLGAFPQQIGVPRYVGWQGPFSGVTDSRGYFEIVVLRTSDATHAITGTLYDGTTRRPIANSFVSVRYKGGLGRGTQVEISVSGYQTEIAVIRTLASSYNPARRPSVHKTYDVGTVYLHPSLPDEGTEPAYMTDEEGRFQLPVEELPNTVVVGTLTRCDTGRPLSGVPVWVRLNPRTGRISVGTVADVGSVEISSPGYGSALVPREKLRFLSSVDVTGRVQRTIDMGTVCLTPQTIPVLPIPIIEVPLEGSVTGTTDSRGKFEVPMPGKKGENVWGTLVDCTTNRPLRNRSFTLTPIYSEKGELQGFRLTSEAFAPELVERFARVDFSLFGKKEKGYHLGKIPVSTKTKEDLERELEPIREGDLPKALRDLEGLDDPARAVLLLGKYLRDKCFRVEASRGKLMVEIDGDREETEWVLLVVHIGNKAYLVESTNALLGTPKIVGLIWREKRARVFVGWEVPYEEAESKVKSYREAERLSLEELERELAE